MTAARRAGPRLARSLIVRRPAAAVIAAAGLLICAAATAGLVGASQAGHGPVRPGPAPFVAVPHGRAAILPDASRHARVAAPVALIIPAIGVRTRLIRLGRTAAGTLQVPTTTAVAGWFTGSPRPGQIGAAVIAGHVDSYLGPGVFFRLRLLRRHEAIYVRTAAGTLVRFRVTAVRLYSKRRFPAAAVYGPVPGAQLRLVTCGGTFDPASGHYLSNVVVFATAARELGHASGRRAASSAATSRLAATWR